MFVGQTPLLDNVLIYYSGHNDTVAGLVEKYEANFGKRIKKADFDGSCRFIGIGPEYKALLLAALRMEKLASTVSSKRLTARCLRGWLCGITATASTFQSSLFDQITIGVPGRMTEQRPGY